MPEIAATESSVAKLQHLVNISEKKTAVALADTLKSTVKKFVSQAKWPALPSQFLSANQPDTTILVDNTGIGFTNENFGLTHDMSGPKFPASNNTTDNTDTFQLATNTVKCQILSYPIFRKLSFKHYLWWGCRGRWIQWLCTSTHGTIFHFFWPTIKQ